MKKNKILRNDIFVCLILILISFIAFFLPYIMKNNNSTEIIEIYQNGKKITALSLNIETEYTLPYTNFTVKIQNGCANVIKSECKDKICEGMKITNKGGKIICLPSKISIKLKKASYVAQRDYDIAVG